MEKLEIKASEGTEKLIVLEGAAVVAQKPSEISIGNGTISAPVKFLEKKKEVYKCIQAHATVNEEQGVIVLRLNEKDSNGLLDTITGKLVAHTLATELGINTAEKFSSKALIESIRRNRAFFVNKTEAGAIITGLRNFSGKVEKRFDAADDLRGNTKDNLETIVSEISFASTYKLNIPIFKGHAKKVVEVEICVDASKGHLQYYLQSDDLYELVITYREELITEAVKGLTEFGCSIINIH